MYFQKRYGMLNMGRTMLSVAESYIIVLRFIRFRDIKTSPRHIIVCIAISDLISSLSDCAGLLILPGMNRPGNSCVIQSLIGTTFILSSFLWTMTLAISLTNLRHQRLV